MRKEIEKVLEAWQKDNLVKNLSKESIETYGASAKDFMGFFKAAGIDCFKKITDDAVKEYVVVQIERNCSARTVNNRLKALRRLCYFYKETYKKSYRVPKIEFQRENATERGPLSNDEVFKIIANLNPKNPDSVLAAVALDTGLRSKSLRNLRVEDVSLDERSIFVRVTKNHDTLKLPITASLAELLRDYLSHFEIVKGYLFHNGKNEKLYDRSSVYKAVKRFMQKCGIEKTGVHTFRYTFGKIMIQNNCNAMVLQRWLGHRTMEETKKYVKLYSQELAELCEKVTPLSENGKIFPKK